MKKDIPMEDNQKPQNQRFYEAHYNSGLEKSEQLARVSNRISRLRISVFITAGLLLFVWYRQKDPVFFLPALALAAVFLLLVYYHSRLEREQSEQENIRSVLREYLARFDDGWKDFPLDGSRYLKDDFPEARDLDLFGKSSLYQYICTAGTVWGQDQLARWLCLPGRGFTKDSAKEVLKEMKSRRQAVEELAKKPELCMEFETGARPLKNIGYEEKKRRMDGFYFALGEKAGFPLICRMIIRLFPFLTLTSLLLALLNISRHLTMPMAMALASAQLLSVLLGFYWNNQILSSIYRINQVITPYCRLFRLLEEESFESPYLQELQKKLLENGTASSALKALERLSAAVSTRHNVYGFLFCNSLYLHDYHCRDRFEKWKKQYRDSFHPWLLELGKVEALISLTVIFRTKENCCLPEFAECEEPLLEASGLWHPLLKERSAVGNDFVLNHRACIITGSNMSGKTTFLRSIGANVALAYAGGVCTAQGLRLSLMELCTSIRTEDNVSQGISTFYAELLRIQQMIRVNRRQVPMICLIDEIYKGTNSKDRIYAAKETIRSLSVPWAVTLVTTHDFELCDLEKEEEIDAVNYHFTEKYRENKILFDYTLRKGRCTTTNARYLLRMAGILQQEE